MPVPAAVPIALGIGQILGSVFGNIFGAKKQAQAVDRSAEIQAQTARELARLEQESLDKQLAYLGRIDERDYADWLAREARDRGDWERSEQRRAPFRALADSAVRTLADYIRVPGMQPAQEVPVQTWTHQPSDPRMVGQPREVSTTMPPTLAGYAQPVRQTPTPGGQPGMFLSPSRPPRRTLADFAPRVSRTTVDHKGRG